MKKNCFFFAIFLFAIASVSQSPTTAQSFTDKTTPLSQPSTSQLVAPYNRADFNAVVANGRTTIAWGNSHLVSFGLGDTGEPISLYEKTGMLLFDAPLSFQNARRVFVNDAVVTNSNTVMVASSAITADGTLADLIVEVGKEGVLRAIRTSPFYALKICATDPGIVWAYGWERDSNGNDRHGHHTMLREYSFERGQLRSAVDRSTVTPNPGIPVSGRRQELQMRCNEENVVLFNGPANELLEYNLKNNDLSRSSLPPLPEQILLTEITGSALTNSGQFYVSIFHKGNPSQTGIFRLNVESKKASGWETITFGSSGGKWFRLIGNDGSNLVYSRGVRSPTLFWSAVNVVEAPK